MDDKVILSERQEELLEDILDVLRDIDADGKTDGKHKHCSCLEFATHKLEGKYEL